MCGLNISMMYTVFFVALLTLVVLFIIVGFVINNIAMFQTPFDIVVGMSSWKHTWEDVPFIYLIGGSFLLGMTIIVVSVVIFDAKLKLKIRALRKEVKRLEQAVNDAKTMLPDSTETTPQNSFTENPEEQADITPDDVTRSFEHSVKSGSFPQEAEIMESFESQPEVSETPMSDPEKKKSPEMPANDEIVDSGQPQPAEKTDS